VAALEHLIATRIPGDWVSQFQLYGKVHWAKFMHKPKPKIKPQLPKYVAWIPSMDPFRVMLGQTHQGPYYVDMGSATPHWGVSGGTGDGKTTALLIPAVHARQHGALVDCITLKTNAFEDIEGESGIRVHKTGADAVAALAEFYVSMKAAENLRGTPEGDTLRPRYLLIDEFGSFVLAAKLWWKYGIGGKGIPPFEAWFHMTLMQGRSSNHRIIVGAHTFSREMFGSTEVRDLVGTKALMGPYSDSKWLVTFGAVEKVEYDSNVKGRGAVGITGQKDIHEIQYAYITPEARGYLRNCPPAPGWFDRGEPAPWITPEAVAQADREAAVGDFLPGGKYMADDSDTAEDGTPHTPTSGPSLAPGVTPGVTPGVSLAKEPQEADGLPLGGSAGTARLKVYSLSDACSLGIIPFKYGTARNKKSKAQKAGEFFPEGTVSAGVTYYTKQELQDWYGTGEDLAQAA
ncbi:type IV secretory system conjugative DNA transfer family protein, partial [Streptomyces sp. NPDC058618]|uniref:type IV secretory system conjugative DNA transfer family protein n=1 Tax=Streptomyces sp. NPDC058618 TaxID=3346558 RepID=UPI003664D770